MVFLCGGSQIIPATNGSSSPGLESNVMASPLQEDAVDLLLAARDGKIPRKRNSFLYCIINS